jgi:signal transduction histidine kinase
MNSLVAKYLSALNEATQVEDLAKLTGDFLARQAGIHNFYLIGHSHHPQPYKLIYPEKARFDFDRWEQDISALAASIMPFNVVQGKKWCNYFLDIAYADSDGEFLVSRNELANEVVDILFVWSHVRQVMQNAQQAERTETTILHGGLYSQLMHDMQAIMDLSANLPMGSALSKRLVYQKKANQNLLFWIRDGDLMKSNVAVTDFIRDSLELIGIKETPTELLVTSDINELTVDIELFSRAFNELILNALEAVEGDFSKIEISVERYLNRSPLFKHHWVKIEIRDVGSGISADFLPFVMNPFFTTGKKKGLTGFGLPIAKKIIEAHRGHLEMKSASAMGTIVKIYLPE